jgi:hypothetical protein
VTAGDQYRDAEQIAGACPVESGLVGSLADNECAHERLPGDATKRCGCWAEEGPVLKVMTTDEQRAAALKLANANKRRQGELRKDVGAGRVTVAHAIGDPALANKLVIDVLSWQSYWGLGRAEAFLRVTKVCTPYAKAGQLTVRQRALIARQLRVKGIAA